MLSIFGWILGIGILIDYTYMTFFSGSTYYDVSNNIKYKHLVNKKYKTIKKLYIGGFIGHMSTYKDGDPILSYMINRIPRYSVTLPKSVETLKVGTIVVIKKLMRRQQIFGKTKFFGDTDILTPNRNRYPDLNITLEPYLFIDINSSAILDPEYFQAIEW